MVRLPGSEADERGAWQYEGIMMSDPVRGVTVLTLLRCNSQTQVLCEILHSRCIRFHNRETLAEARTLLHREPPDLVICERNLTDGADWKDVLTEIEFTRGLQPLIVISRLADDAFW